jgi:hypothetical protein
MIEEFDMTANLIGITHLIHLSAFPESRLEADGMK